MSVSSIDLERLKKATNLRELAAVLNVPAAQLSYVLYKLPAEVRYHTFSIPKKRGGERVINAPDERLKFIQRRLASILLRIEQEREAGRRRNSIIAHGFKRELSIVTNATRHRNKRFVFNIDLKDFFPSLNFGRVRGFFISNKKFEMTKEAATVIAQIACHENMLPQGSPCSPPISNLIANILDIRLATLARDCRCTYTRYADDLTFSTNEKSFPDRIAVHSGGLWQPSEELISRIEAAGFAINTNKTRMQYRNSRQDTTGLIVNRKLNVPSEYYADTRAMCHHLFEGRPLSIRSAAGPVPLEAEQLRGRLGFIYHIRSLAYDLKKPEVMRKMNFYRLYRQFLNYASFWGNNEPLIVCEGKTDNIYIKSAILALAPKFPQLFAEPGSKGRIALTFFKYTKIAKEVQDLSGGNGQLKNLLAEYETRTAPFKTAPKFPVIIVTDVDKGAVDLFKVMSSMLKKTVAGADPWYFMGKNLYVVPVPIKGAETAIEDLFEEKLLKREIDGKKFDRTNHEKDGAKFYSKFTFATKIVAVERSSIDFSGFEPLLKAIADVQADYAKRVAAAPAKPTAVASGGKASA